MAPHICRGAGVGGIAIVGAAVGALVGADVGKAVGDAVGIAVGAAVGKAVGATVGEAVGTAVGDGVCGTGGVGGGAGVEVGMHNLQPLLCTLESDDHNTLPVGATPSGPARPEYRTPSTTR
jgi:hypothetical protein